MINRRAFITSLTIGALLASRSAHAQKARGMHRIGWLSPASAADGLPNLEALRAGLRGIGYVEGKNITFEVRWADGRSNRLPQLAAELVRLPVDVLCTAGSQATGAAKQATSTIPIVFANVAFPDKSGIVASYPRPGANITGVACRVQEGARSAERHPARGLVQLAVTERCSYGAVLVRVAAFG